jgi:hypothetical protein
VAAGCERGGYELVQLLGLSEDETEEIGRGSRRDLEDAMEPLTEVGCLWRHDAVPV